MVSGFGWLSRARTSGLRGGGGLGLGVLEASSPVESVAALWPSRVVGGRVDGRMGSWVWPEACPLK